MKTWSVRFNKPVILVIPLLYLVIAILTLGNYGINWDTPKHVIRGQAYLHFILTGKRDFLDLPSYAQSKGLPNKAAGNVRRSYFQSDFYTFDYFMTKHVHTHPEVNDLLSAISNYVFYQKIGILDDIESHHLFIVLSVFALSVALALWTYANFGILASLVASISLVGYPLVFSESHFNVKDPVLMSFFGLAILFFWFGLNRGKYAYILVSALFSGFALGTKFNALFLPLILGPWALFHLVKRYRASKKNRPSVLDLLGGTQVLLSVLAYPVVALGVLFIFSPYLWINPIGHFMEIVNYYKGIGAGTPDELSRYLVGGWNMYPLVWIWYTTPLPVLGLSLVGLLYSVYLVIRKNSDIALLVLLWLAVPLIRVMWPGTNIYGGVRQIMEFIPALAILAAIGAFSIVQSVSISKKITVTFIAASFLFVAYEQVKIHPNQNVYFNQLVGGLSGAYDKKIPAAGNEYGNTYLQGINWLNNNAEANTKLALAVNYISSIPGLKLREDISLDNAHWSGPLHRGEYVMEMSHESYLKLQYKYAYLETFLDPVYRVSVDGVPLLTIWKNDPQYVKPGYEKEIPISPSSVKVEEIRNKNKVIQKKLKIDFAQEVFLTRLIIGHETGDCASQGQLGFVSTLQDGENWIREPGLLTDPESPYQYIGMDENTFVSMFPARPAKSVVLNTELPNPCILKNYNVTVQGLNK